MSLTSYDKSVPIWKRCVIAVRPFAFPASIIPVLTGTALAASLGRAEVNGWLLLASLFAMLCLHAGANIINDINDFRRGLDKIPTPVSGAIVRGLMSPRQALIEAIVLLAIGSTVGIHIVLRTTPALLLIGAVGIAVGVFYTVPPISLKYHALGDLAVFLNFGLLGSLGAWVVQTRTVSWTPVLYAVPVGLLIVGILHANNWRDTVTDRACRVRTVAGLLGDTGSLLYYGFLLFGPFILVALATFPLFPKIPPLSPFALIAWGALPAALACWKKAVRRHTPRHPTDFIALDGATAQLNLIFGLLYTFGIAIPAFWGRPL